MLGFRSILKARQSFSGFSLSSFNESSLSRLFSSSKLEEVRGLLQSIKADGNKSILDQKVVLQLDVDEESKTVDVRLRLDQNYRKTKGIIEEKLKGLHWVSKVNVTLAPKSLEQESDPKANLKQVKNIIAVSSCKGGVGKSTVAVNLAFALQKAGLKVGIFDADVYGPSLPTLLGKEQERLHSYEDNPKEIIPIEFNGTVKTMSYGYASPMQRAAIRGPLVSSIVSQLLFQTRWGELDYLVIDMPPGTGDIQLTLCQEVSFTAAVIVTTPQKLSFIDVVKGIEFFQDLKVPCVSVIENMALHVCGKCGNESRPYGLGYVNRLIQQFGIKASFQIPLAEVVSKYSDLGSPLVEILPEEHTIQKIYKEIASAVESSVASLAETNKVSPTLFYDTASRKLLLHKKPDEPPKRISPYDLRRLCGCALCVDEFTGQRLLRKEQISEEVFPHKIEKKGNYAVAVVWSDGHKSSIYPFERLFSDEIPEVEKEKREESCKK